MSRDNPTPVRKKKNPDEEKIFHWTPERPPTYHVIDRFGIAKEVKKRTHALKREEDK